MNSPNNTPNILIVEDDSDQMEMLVSIVLSEIQALIDNEGTSDKKAQILKGLQVLKVSNVESLKRAGAMYKGTILALLDCNIPDTKNGPANDQLVKTNHRITGQHRSVDIVSKYLPDAPITMISSLNRFQKIVSLYYKRTFGININFISKNDMLMIQKNIGYYLRSHAAKIDE